VSRHLPQKPAAFETEDAAPDAIEVDRHDRHVQAADDALEAALEGQQVAGAADRALGEDAHDMAGFELAPRALDGLDDVLASGRDRNRVHAREQRVQARLAVVRRVDHEPHEALDARADQRAVDHRHVVGDDQRRSVGRDVRLADDADAVDRVRQHPQHEADEEVGQLREDVDVRDQRESARGGENLAEREVQPLAEQVEDGRGGQHPDGVEDVVRREDAAEFVIGRPLLEQRVQGHREEAAGRAEQDEDAGGQPRSAAP
jgi:hypothetical protein